MSDEYIKLNDNELKKLHKDLLTILLELDRICRKHNIRYFLSGGTLLGAIRHKGFIPWDDDIDVEMMREDYDKFCEICKSELNHEKFFLQTQNNDINYNWVYGKLRLKGTEYVRVGQDHLKQKTGIFIDIFPIDNTKNNKVSQYIISRGCEICRSILWSNVGVKISQSYLQKIKYRVLSIIPRKAAINIFEYLAKLYNDIDTNYRVFYNLKLKNRKCYIYESKWYEEELNVEFEKYKFPIPIGYKYILEMYYGDYMKLPEKDKRKGNCDALYIKFSDGYEVQLNNKN